MTTPELPEGWSEDTRAPFLTYYSDDGSIGVTRDEDGTGRWFPLEWTAEDEEMLPMGCPDWSTRPPMFDTPEEAIQAALGQAPLDPRDEVDALLYAAEQTRQRLTAVSRRWGRDHADAVADQMELAAVLLDRDFELPVAQRFVKRAIQTMHAS